PAEKEAKRTVGTVPPARVGGTPRLKILLSFDHELSLGSADSYARNLFDPTDGLLELADLLRVPITLFTDVCAAIRFRDWDHKGYFVPYQQQVRRAVEQGHDVQLHIHPHWIDSSYQNGRFIPAMTYTLGCFRDRRWPDSIPGIVERGVAMLNELCLPCRADYQCIAFRAGGFCLAPETASVLAALYDAGIRIDSSIAKGNYIESAAATVDHRNMPARANWFIARGGPLDREADEGLYEIPIAARPRTPWNNVPFLVKRVWYRSRRHRSDGLPFDEGRISLPIKIRRLFPQSAWMLGFDNFTSGVSELMSILAYHVRTHAHEDTVACSAISHPKYMGVHSRQLMQQFVERVRAEYGTQVEFCTYRAIYDKLLRSRAPATAFAQNQ
ncbi:MAG: hypothetical protein ABSG53_05715, partial [Thermoguttaceae bacterium]